jgi:hypothetical protein
MSKAKQAKRIIKRGKARKGKLSLGQKFQNLALEDEYVVRVMEGLPTKRIAEELRRRRHDEALEKRERAKAKGKRSSASW